MYKLQLQERLSNAVEMGDLLDVDTCLRMGAKLDEIPWGTESLLMRAIRCKQREVAEHLIKKGIDVNYVYVKSDSPRSETANYRDETAREYGQFYNMPDIVEMIDKRRKDFH